MQAKYAYVPVFLERQGSRDGGEAIQPKEVVELAFPRPLESDDVTVEGSNYEPPDASSPSRSYGRDFGTAAHSEA